MKPPTITAQPSMISTIWIGGRYSSANSRAARLMLSHIYQVTIQRIVGCLVVVLTKPSLVTALAGLLVACSSGGGGGGTGGDARPVESCLGSSLLTALGKQRLIIGVSGSDGAAASAPFDVRYNYLSGGLFQSETPCTACGASCPGGWWGCYNTPPGAYATMFMTKTAMASQVPMFSYYELLQTALAANPNFQEGTAEVTQTANDVGIMTRYYNDWRFLLQQIGTSRVMIHIEPDFWGYVRQAGDPTTLPAAVGSANSTDCGSLPSTVGGMGQCMITMARRVRTERARRLAGVGVEHRR